MAVSLIIGVSLGASTPGGRLTPTAGAFLIETTGYFLMEDGISKFLLEA